MLILIKRFFYLLTLIPFFLIAGESTYKLKTLHSRIRFDYQQLSMPNNDASMGLVGVHYDAYANDWLYGGLGSFAAVTGRHGGLTTLGAEVGITHQIYGPIRFDIGAYYGAGGGGTAAVGTGSLFEPYAGLSYDFDPIHVGLGYRYFNYLNGRIKTSAVGVYVDVPMTLHYANSSYAGIDFNHTIDDDFEGSSPYAEKDYLALISNNYFPQKNTKNTSGVRKDNTINLLGVEYGHYFNEDGFVFLRADGAYRGTESGYIDVLGGVGYSFDITNHVMLIQPKIALGAGGGGGVDTGGGYLINPELGLLFPIGQHVALQLNGGYLIAPQGDFKGLNASASLQYVMDLGSFNILENNSALNRAYFQGWKMKLGNLTVLKAARDSGQKRNLNLITTDLDFMLGKYAYIAAQAGMARSGGAANFKTAMAGFGFTTNSRVGIYGQALVGAAGGGGFATHQGLVAMPEIGLYANLTQLWSIHAAYGYLKSLEGARFSSSTVNVGISYNFATLMGW